LKVLNDWTEKSENGGRIGVLYTDLAKAFDRIPHIRLLPKMKKIKFAYSSNRLDKDIFKR